MKGRDIERMDHIPATVIIEELVRTGRTAEASKSIVLSALLGEGENHLPSELCYSMDGGFTEHQQIDLSETLVERDDFETWWNGFNNDDEAADIEHQQIDLSETLVERDDLETLWNGFNNEEVAGISEPVNSLPKEAAKRILRQQEELILKTLTELGYPPKALPPNIPGKAGVRSECRKKLTEPSSASFSPLFEGSTTFNKAWERLSNFQEIVYAPR